MVFSLTGGIIVWKHGFMQYQARGQTQSAHWLVPTNSKSWPTKYGMSYNDLVKLATKEAENVNSQPTKENWAYRPIWHHLCRRSPSEGTYPKLFTFKDYDLNGRRWSRSLPMGNGLGNARPICKEAYPKRKCSQGSAFMVECPADNPKDKVIKVDQGSNKAK